MEGKETRFGIVASALFAVITTAASCGAVNRDARLVHAARRHGPADQYRAGRDHRRRRRRRPLRNAAVRHPGDLRRRPDGRPHARIRRQEDRGERSQNGHARDPDPAADVSRLDGDRGGGAAGGWPRSPIPARTASARSSTPSPRRPANNGSAFGGLTGNIAVLQHHRRHRDAGRPVLDDHSGDGDRRLARGEEIGPAVGGHVPDRPAGCLSAWSWA